MKRAMIKFLGKLLGLLLVLSLLTSAEASDPKTNQITQAGTAITGGVMAGALAIILWTQCGPENILSCILAGAATAAAGASLGTGVMSIANADELDSKEEGAALPDFNSEALSLGNPTLGGFGGQIPQNLIKDADLQKIEQAQLMMEEAKSQGKFSDEMLANPEKFLSAKELAQFNAEKEKIMAGEFSQENEDFQETLKTALEESESQDLQTASLTVDSGTASFSSFNLDSFLNLKEKGIQNSAPGYYGNVSLKSLQPKSKLSLFERVSLKLKQEMKKS